MKATIRISTHKCNETSFTNIHKKKIQIYKQYSLWSRKKKLMTNVIKGNDRLVVNQINYFFFTFNAHVHVHIAMFQPNVLFEGLNHNGCGTFF